MDAQGTIHDDAAGPEAVRRILIDHIDGAARSLEGEISDSAGTVHSFRKRMKRARAGIRLISDADGSELRFLEHSCRDVAKTLSDLRDLDVMIGTLGSQTKEVDAWPVGFGDVLAAEREHILSRGVLSEATRSELIGQLHAVREALAAVPVGHICAADLKLALRKSHRKARSASRLLGEAATDEHFHDLRKRAKREYYQRELLARAISLHHPRRTQRLDELCELLGDQQDIAVLRQKAADTGYLSPLLDKWLVKRRDRCRKMILKSARALYR